MQLIAYPKHACHSIFRLHLLRSKPVVGKMHYGLNLRNTNSWQANVYRLPNVTAKATRHCNDRAIAAEITPMKTPV